MKIYDINELPQVFLTVGEIPKQTQTLRVGDRVRIDQYRYVVRVGYRKVPSDYHDVVREKLRENDTLRVLETHFELPTILGFGVLRTSRVLDKLMDALAFALATADRFGGNDRGIVVSPDPHVTFALAHGPAIEHHIDSVRRVQVGTRYPSNGSHDDYEPGGLTDHRTITICSIAGHEFMGGDLTLVEAAARPKRKRTRKGEK